MEAGTSRNRSRSTSRGSRNGIRSRSRGILRSRSRGRTRIKQKSKGKRENWRGNGSSHRSRSRSRGMSTDWIGGRNMQNRLRCTRQSQESRLTVGQDGGSNSNSGPNPPKPAFWQCDIKCI